MQTQDRSTQPVNFINFHGITLLVVQHGGIDYVEAKPLCDLTGTDWRGARRALQEGDNATLYGVKRLIPPQIAGARGLKSPFDEVLYLRLDRSRMYLARISTDRMRANGNETGADQVLALQVEWADVLHRYETHGIAAKAGRNNAVRDLYQIVKTRALMIDARERKAITHLLHQELREAGLPIDTFDDAQQELPLSQTP